VCCQALTSCSISIATGSLHFLLKNPDLGEQLRLAAVSAIASLAFGPDTPPPRV
jgi:hypothetical protein